MFKRFFTFISKRKTEQVNRLFIQQGELLQAISSAKTLPELIVLDKQITALRNRAQPLLTSYQMEQLRRELNRAKNNRYAFLLKQERTNF